MLVKDLKKSLSKKAVGLGKLARPRKQGQTGFTLIELVLAIVILGSVSIMFIPFYQSIAHSPDPVIRQRGIALAQGLMDEIMAKKWDNNSPVGGGPLCTGESTRGGCTVNATSLIVGLETEATRANYAAVDDYAAHSEADIFRDQNEDSFTMTGYSRQVQVCYIASTSNPITHATTCVTGSTTDSKLIVVTVTTPTNETLRLVSVSCNI
ncbi:MAG TPA: hypothetical protein DEQ20_07600 [Desulfobulbaceae bacterium]|nr:MAG: hypothetical protein A2520_03900 [Deltaproteobacteria bacterium RIFOXYD12_FULL_53_23]HCC54771.1 hypothetical protein [Desulfobulbaceae bacterium]